MTGNSLAFSECLAAQVEAMQFHKASFAGAQHVAGWKGSGQLIGRATVLRNGRLYEPEPSANPVFRAVIAIDEEDVRHAFVKDLPPKLLANELIASALARWIGLPIPDPYFVRVAEGFLPLKYAPRLDDGSGYLAFASVDADTPSLARFYDSNDPVASREIWPQTCSLVKSCGA